VWASFWQPDGVPWCEACSRFLTPTSLDAGGACPSCGRVLLTPAEADPKAPWHFKLLLVGVALYLGYRLVQGVGWLL
jgi:hypothetical protein